MQNFDQARSSFMDAKGLYFYMPILLLLSDSVAQDSVLMHCVIKEYPENLELMQLLTQEQKQSILDCLAVSVDYDASVAFYGDYKGQA